MPRRCHPHSLAPVKDARMADEPRLLPLFPLHAVLFPHMEMPLRIFEPRYRAEIDKFAKLVKEAGIPLVD